MDEVIRIVGDVHGKIRPFIDLVKNCRYSIQVGDMGFRTSYEVLSNELSSANHRFIPGNHDDYSGLPPHALYDYGVCGIGNMEFFYFRGERSIDKAQRMPFISWWPQEELTYSRAMQALDFYNVIKPKVVIAHGCPSSVIDQLVQRRYWDGELIRPSFTAQFLQLAFDAWQPDVWYFGHYHVTKSLRYNGTLFQCLDELAYLDLTLDGKYVS